MFPPTSNNICYTPLNATFFNFLASSIETFGYSYSNDLRQPIIVKSSIKF